MNKYIYVVAILFAVSSDSKGFESYPSDGYSRDQDWGRGSGYGRGQDWGRGYGRGQDWGRGYGRGQGYGRGHDWGRGYGYGRDQDQEWGRYYGQGAGHFPGMQLHRPGGCPEGFPCPNKKEKEVDQQPK